MDFRNIVHHDQFPLVTIGMSSYNYSAYIKDALNSLLGQTYSNIELIIIDDCSADDSVNIIREWIVTNNVTCTFIVHDINCGITKTSNELVKLAKGKYISLFASDDIMLPQKIEHQVQILETAGEEYGMCYAIAETMDEDGNKTGFYNEVQPHYEGDMLEYFVHGWLTFATPTSLIRMSVYDSIGFYDERMLLEDYDFWIRLFARYKAKYCDYPSIIYRVKKQSAVFDDWRKNNNERYYYDRILSNFKVLPYIKENVKLKEHLQNKISQYLKALEACRSKYVPELIKYLLKHGYFRIPIKVVLSNFYHLNRSR